MRKNFRSWLVASAVTVTAVSVSAAGLSAQEQTSPAQQSPTQQSPSSQPAQQEPSSSSSSSASSQGQASSMQGRDEAAARQELVQAKQALSDLTKMPEASQLQGEARTGVIEIINSFNALVTAESNWHDRYKAVEQQLARVLGSDGSATASTATEAGSVGTSGSTSASSADLPAPIRSKLVEFRQHLQAFGKAAGAPEASASGSTSGSPSQPPATSSSSPSTGSTETQQGAAGQSSATAETFQQHLDAMSDLLQQALSGAPAAGSTSGTGSEPSTTAGTSGSSSTTGSSSSAAGQPGSSSSASSASSPPAGSVIVDRATLDQLQSHLQRLRQLARQRGIE